jgi:5-methylcytosine-specific restriction endonuclease McrA
VAKLATLKVGIASLPPRFAGPPPQQTREQARAVSEPWRRWYKLKRWRDLRISVFTRDEGRCKLCGWCPTQTSQLVCDHVEPHGGDPVKFWSGPFQTLCSMCHSVHKQAEERGAPAMFRPAWLKPSLVPLTIVCGPPASGKTTYIKANKGIYDIVIDLDEIVARWTGRTSHNWDRAEWLTRAIRARNAMLHSISTTTNKWPAAWFIVSAPKAEERDWWARKLAPIKTVLLMPDERTCLERSLLDADRDRATTATAISAWMNDYTPRPTDIIVA